MITDNDVKINVEKELAKLRENSERSHKAFVNFLDALNNLFQGLAGGRK